MNKLKKIIGLTVLLIVIESNLPPEVGVPTDL